MPWREEGGTGGDAATAVLPAATATSLVASVGVVVVTRDRRTALLATLRRLESDPMTRRRS